MRKAIPKPFSEKTKAEQLAEAHKSIVGLERAMTGDNRFGSYGARCRDAIRAWQTTIKRLETSEG
jgi:hypothetical protein